MKLTGSKAQKSSGFITVRPDAEEELFDEPRRPRGKRERETGGPRERQGQRKLQGSRNRPGKKAQGAVRIHYQSERRAIAVMAAFDILLLILAYFFMLNARINDLTPAWIIRNASVRMTDLFNLLSGRPLQSGMNFFLYRLLMVMLSGAALAAAGAVYQAVFRNPLASPTILGVQTGGGLGAALYLLFFVSPAAPTVTYGADAAKRSFTEAFFTGNAMQYFMILSCFISLLIVVGLSRAVSRGQHSPLPMILCGTVFSSLCVTVISMLQNFFMISDPYATRLDALGSVMTGSFEQVYSLAHLLGMAIPILLFLGILIRSGEKLNGLTLDPKEIRTTGMDSNRYSMIYLLLATGMTAVVVAFCGTFTFVGLVSPFLCRRIVGANNRWLVPASALAGAALTMFAYWFAYAIGLTALVNISLSVIGGVVFAVMIFRGRGGSYE